MKSIAISGAPGKDLHIKIDSVQNLPAPFKRHLRKSIAYSRVPHYYGKGWNIRRVLKELRKRAIEPLKYSYGGRGPHVAYGIAKLGGSVRLITVFGEDFDEAYPGFFGGGYWSHLRKAGVRMTLLEVEVPTHLWGKEDALRSYLEQRYAPSIYESDAIKVKEKETMTIVCCKDRDGVDFFYVDDKAGAGYIEIGRPAPRKILERVDIVFVTTSEPQFMEDVILTASQLGKEVMVDIGSYGITPRFLQKIIPLAKIIFGNEAEIKQVCGAFEARKIEDIFELTGTCFPEVIILEDKFNGSISLYTREEVTRVGPIPLRKTGSSTGCCDGMAAGFLFFYQHGLNLDLCAKAGLVLCSTIWEVEGVQEGMPTPQEFYDRFVAYFGSEYSSAQLNEIKRLLDHRAPHNF